MAKWGRGSKVPGYGRLLSKFDQSFSYSGGLIESCPKPGTFDHLPPFAIHILNPLDMRNHRDPLFMGQKCTQYGRETKTSQVFGNCGSLSPPPTNVNRVRWVILVNMVISVILGHEKTKIQKIIDLGKIDVFSVRTNTYIKNKKMGHLIRPFEILLYKTFQKRDVPR